MTLYRWTDETLQLATSGVWQQLTAGVTTTNIITDTRKLQAGDVFLAIKGDNFDGHDYVQIAADKGAVAVIVNEVQKTNVPQLVVADTKLALGKLGQYRRDAHPDLTVIALTGSSGKTTTKEMLGSILNQIAPTLITRGNLNNDLGVPMMLLELTDEHRFAVIELGANHVGEIAYTAGLVRPDVACVLNIGTAHLGEFGGRDNIAKTKAEIFGALGADGVAVLPFGDEYFDYLYTQATQFTQKIITFGEKNVPLAWSGIDLMALSDAERAEFATIDTVLMMGDVFADDIEADTTHSEFSLNVNLEVDEIDSVDVHLPFVGEHNVTNALASSAMAVALDVPLETIGVGLAMATPPKGRLTFRAFGEHTLIDDTYNANPNSILAAARVLESQAGQKILVLGDIGELGERAKMEHFELGKKLALLNIDVVLTVGVLMAHCTQAINELRAGLSVHFDSKDDLLIHLNTLLNKQSVVLFKGSRTAKIETVIYELTRE